MGEHSDAAHICQCLSRILELRRQETLTVSAERRRTGEEFVAGVIGLARGLQELNVQSGDVIAIAALNSEWYMEWLLAVAFVGAIAAPMNYRWSLEEARTATKLVSPVMLVVDEACSGWVSSMKISSVKFVVLMGEFPSAINLSNSDTIAINLRHPSKSLTGSGYLTAPSGIAIICFTSGTTGMPKAVSISHMSLIVQTLAKISITGYCEDDVYLHTAPLCHIGGLCSCISVLMSGGCHVFYPKFEAKTALQAIEQNNVTSFITVPTMMADLVTHTRQRNRWSGGVSVRKILNGGGELMSELITAAMQLFPNAKLISAYGMTEACSSLTFKTLHDPASGNTKHSTQSCDEPSLQLVGHYHFGGSCVGKPPPHVELQICCDQQNGSALGVGRIITRGPHVMVGYCGSVSTSSSIEHSRDWFDTGDVGWIDLSGNLWLVGRSKDMIKSGGENIYPQEVESVLLRHPGVAQVVVIGIPDYRLAEMVVACINIREGWTWVDEKNIYCPDTKEISRELLQKFCRNQNMSRFKIPKHFILWNTPFPLTSTGKPKRNSVRREVMNYMQLIPSNL